MAHKAPGKSHRKGLTLLQVVDMFKDEETSKTWLTEQRWPEGPRCPYCDSPNVQSNIKHKTMTHRCRDCEDKPMFSIKTGTVMEGSKLKYRIWAIGIYLFTTNIKGISSMKLHRELGIGQKAAWFMLHRLRKAYEIEVGPFSGPVEVDETFIGGKEKNKHEDKRSHTRGPSGKAVVVGMKDRKTNKVIAKPVPDRTKEEIHGFIQEAVSPESKVYSDDHKSYLGLPYDHESVNHSVGEYVREQAHTNGVESFWALMKRGYYGIYHRISPKHLGRYVNEFSGRYNVREQDIIAQMRLLAKGMAGKRLPYKELVK